MFTYRITFIIGKLDANANPPVFIPVLFPNFNGEPVILCDEYCDVTFNEPQTPVNISPLIKVELLNQ